MEDWQEWQLRADQIAAALGEEIDTLERDFFSEPKDTTFRGFWPRFRDLKERVRTAPAIKLEDKLNLERRLRDLGSRAYKGQEAAYGRSQERKNELLEQVSALRQKAEGNDSPRGLLSLRKDLDHVRAEFESRGGLMPSDRQTVWDAWKEASQAVWNRLTGIWDENETYLRGILAEARSQLETGNIGAARQGVSKFFDALGSHECRQSAVGDLKSTAASIRDDGVKRENERRTAARAPAQRAPEASPVETWKAELDRNRQSAERLSGDVVQLEQQVQMSESLLEQAMLRGTLVDKKRKLSEVERANRSLERKIEQAEETPAISSM